MAGSGVTGDLLAHCIDTALWLNGSISNVTAMTETFVKERPAPGPVPQHGDDVGPHLAPRVHVHVAVGDADVREFRHDPVTIR